MAASRHVKQGFGGAIVMAVAVANSLAAEEPSAAEIMQTVRIYQVSQHQEMEGRLRNEDLIIPFRLVIDGGVMRYQLANPPETLTVRLTGAGSKVEEGGRSVSASDLKSPVRGTDVTLEDLSMNFLYWDRAELDGEQTVLGGRPSWRVILFAPSRRESSYGSVRLWVDKGSGALVRAEAYDWSGKAAKRFEVRSIQRYGNGWLLKQMRIQELNGTRSRDTTPTYLEIQKPD